MSARMIVSSIVICVLALSLQLRGESRRLLGRDALVGKWEAAVTPDGNNGHDFKDTITIKGGKFGSEELAKQGYEPADYDDKVGPLGVAAQFSVTLTNKDGDTAKWTGTVSGPEMTGDLTITKKNGDAVTYTFSATKPH